MPPPDQNAKEFAGSHHCAKEFFEIWWKHGSGWFWAETSMPDDPGKGPFATSKEAFDNATTEIGLVE